MEYWGISGRFDKLFCKLRVTPRDKGHPYQRDKSFLIIVSDDLKDASDSPSYVFYGLYELTGLTGIYKGAKS